LLLCTFFVFSDVQCSFFFFFISSSFDPDGVGKYHFEGMIMIIYSSILDVFFLNRQSMRNVKSAEELIPVFAVPPAGK
jgi:hypothetical protein